MSLGTMLFYGGIGGMGLTVLVTIIVSAVLSASRKRIRIKLNYEYGESKNTKTR